MKAQPTVSVVTCIRNQRSDYFQECATSVLEQGSLIEWIIVDDASDDSRLDEYRDIVGQASREFSTILVSLPSHVGLASARNTGLRMAQGDWVITLDSDDRLGSGIAATLQALRPNVQLVACDSDYFSDSQVQRFKVRAFEQMYKTHGGSSLDPFLWYDFYYHGIIGRRELLQRIGGYQDGLMVGEDQDILLRALEETTISQVLFLSDLGYEYRQNPDGVCSTRWNEVLDNYCTTMLAAANRRQAPFLGCRQGQVTVFEGADIDCYEYLGPNDQWFTWLSWREFSQS